MKQTKKIALSSILTALCVLLLCLGSLLKVLVMTAVALASFLIFFAELEMRGPYPLLVWLAASLLSFLLYPGGTAVLLFALFGGFYPVCKMRLERLPRALSYLLKLLLFTAAFFACWLISTYVLMIPSEFGIGSILFWAFLGLAEVAFLLFDLLLSRFIGVYIHRLRPKIARFLN